MIDEGSPRQGPARALPPDSHLDADEQEPLGGDPPCWAHLFGEDPGPTAEELEAAAPPDPRTRPEAG